VLLAYGDEDCGRDEVASHVDAPHRGDQEWRPAYTWKASECVLTSRPSDSVHVRMLQEWAGTTYRHPDGSPDVRTVVARVALSSGRAMLARLTTAQRQSLQMLAACGHQGHLSTDRGPYHGIVLSDLVYLGLAHMAERARGRRFFISARGAALAMQDTEMVAWPGGPGRQTPDGRGGP
jgi:hypothetical protein